MKIVHERRKCIGCGSCVVLCPKHWEMGKDGKAHLLGSDLDHETEDEILDLGSNKSGCNQDAVDVCPVRCIHIIRKNKNTRR